MECEYCSTDLYLGMNWWYEIPICNNCHNERLADPDYVARLDALEEMQ